MENTKNKAEQLLALKSGNDIQHILNEAYKILGNPILVHDMDYKVISCTENIVTDDPIWNEFITTGTVSLSRIEFYKDENFLDLAASTKKTTFLHSDQLKYDRIYAKLFNGDNIQIGCACIPEVHVPFGDDDPALFELFCDTLNKVFAKSEFYLNYGQEYQELLINKLINENIENREIYTAHIESIYMNLKTYLNLAVAYISQSEPANNDLASFRDLFKRTQPNFKYSIFDNYIVIIMSSEKPYFHVKETLNKFNKIFRHNNIYAGISSGFENLFELQKYYFEALTALNHGLKGNGTQRIFLYDEM